MIRVQIQLRRAQALALRKMAAEQRVSIAELIRRALDQTLNARAPLSGRRHMERLRTRMERFDPGIKDLAERHDHDLAEAFADDGDVR